ncbi:MAG: type II methionyl aminopeptidase, partial [Thermoprotei archaeon]
DRSVILKGAVVKVDIGVQVDGYIADAAVTISFNPSYERLVKAAKEALSKVQNILRPGVPLRNAGKIVKDVAEKWGVRPIANLSGHKVERYNLHAGKTVPNVPSWDISRAEEGEVYAVEPFMTNGEGLVVEGGEGHIYRVKSMKKVKDKELVEALNLIWRRYKSLPFSERWLLDAFEDPLDIIKRLVQKSRIYSYPALLERSGGIVTQYEDTFIVHDKEAEALVRVINLV